MSNITYEKSPCKCMSCNYLLCAIKLNEDNEGNYDLKIYCQVTSCPIRRQEEEMRVKQQAEREAKRTAAEKITACIEMLKHCIELKNASQKGRIK